MTNSLSVLRPLARLAPILAALSLLAACASSDTVATPVDTGPAQPRLATYSCADGAAITVENRGSSVRVTSVSGEGIDLPASPADQQNRYVSGADAIVLEGDEALYMHGNSPPLTCAR